MSFTLPKQSQRSDTSSNMDLDIWDCFGRKKKKQLHLITEEIRQTVGVHFYTVKPVLKTISV